jgi:ATP-dependent NAD(P)H-hydrate dehydratase
MVHPLMRQSSHAGTFETASSIASKVIDMLPRLHVLVIGPGLGRDPLMQDTCARVIEAARKQNLPFVLDADGLILAQVRPELVQGYKECILTPNVVEFGRLCKSKGIDTDKLKDGKGAEELARAFGGVTILQKGGKDYISDGDHTFVCDMPGGLKRSGGQGDTLTGSLATFLAWRKAYLDKLWDHEGDLDSVKLLALAAFGGSALTRVSSPGLYMALLTRKECSRLAFAKKGRSLQASDLTEEVHVAFQNLFEESSPKL